MRTALILFLFAATSALADPTVSTRWSAIAPSLNNDGTAYTNFSVVKWYCGGSMTDADNVFTATVPQTSAGQSVELLFSDPQVSLPDGALPCRATAINDAGVESTWSNEVTVHCQGGICGPLAPVAPVLSAQ